MSRNIEQLCRVHRDIDELVEKSARLLIAAHNGEDEENKRFCIECAKTAAREAGKLITEKNGHPEGLLAYQADAFGAAFERIHLYA